jgi:hypothetical protein
MTAAGAAPQDSNGDSNGERTPGPTDQEEPPVPAAPLDHQNVIRLLQPYDELLAERDHLVSLPRLTPAWGEVREVLNELSATLGGAAH